MELIPSSLLQEHTNGREFYWDVWRAMMPGNKEMKRGEFPLPRVGDALVSEGDLRDKSHEFAYFVYATLCDSPRPHLPLSLSFTPSRTHRREWIG